MHPLDAEAQPLLAELEQTRQLTFELVALATDEELCTAYHPDFSPIGWHLGHIATFEAFWVQERAHGEPPLSPAFDILFDPRQVAKPDRTRLPPRSELLAFAAEARRRTLETLFRDAAAQSASELLNRLFVYRFILSHEQQHAETIATILRMRPPGRREAAVAFRPTAIEASPRLPHLRIPACATRIGEDDVLTGYDNERPAFSVELGAYEIDSHPVTNGDWLAFIEAGGYRRREWWSTEGWAWREAEHVEHPFYWRPVDAGFVLESFTGDVPLPLTCPVEGVSAHEADAYARFVGKRLPTELEWEHAARQHREAHPHLGVRCGGARPVGGTTDFVGNVWEWTSSSFDGYPGFEAFPYDGYSRAYFDGAHRVLRGGSWATQGRIARPAFRNWYQPHWRAMFVGLRCARDC